MTSDDGQQMFPENDLTNHIKKLLRESGNLVDFQKLLCEKADPEILKKLSMSTSFNDRVQMMKGYFKRLGAGSSRIVYDYDDNTVIKLAKNRKGLAQNGEEARWATDRYFNHILTKIIQYDDNGYWIQVEKASKLSESKFLEIQGYSFDDYCNHITAVQAGGGSTDVESSQRIYEIEEEAGDYFSADVVEFARSNGLKTNVGDYCRMSSYGVVKREDYEAVVLVDYGLSDDIYINHYK